MTPVRPRHRREVLRHWWKTLSIADPTALGAAASVGRTVHGTDLPARRWPVRTEKTPSDAPIYC